MARCHLVAVGMKKWISQHSRQSQAGMTSGFDASAMEAALRAWFVELIANKAGSTATEYAFVAAIFAIFVIVSARSVGAEIFDLYTFVSENIAVALQGGEVDP